VCVNGRSPDRTGKNVAVAEKSTTPVKPIISYYQNNNEGLYMYGCNWLLENNNSNRANRLSPFKVGKLIYKKFNSINYICSKFKSRIEIKLSDLQTEANLLVKETSFEDNDLKAFIPNNRLWY